MEISKEQFAWIAGLLEGEGSFCISAKTGQPIITLSMTDEDTVKKFCSLTGYSCYEKRQMGIGTKPIFIGRSSSPQKLMPVLVGILPWMGQRRTEKILQLIKEAERRMEARADFQQKVELAKELHNRGILQSSIAVLAGVSRPTISRWMAEDRRLEWRGQR